MGSQSRNLVSRSQRRNRKRKRGETFLRGRRLKVLIIHCSIKRKKAATPVVAVAPPALALLEKLRRPSIHFLLPRLRELPLMTRRLASVALQKKSRRRGQDEKDLVALFTKRK